MSNKKTQLRTVLLPTIGDPYLLQMWLRIYRDNIKPVVNGLIVCLGSHIDSDVMDKMVSLVEAEDGRVLKTETVTQHGTRILHLLEEAPEGNVVLMEDDVFVFSMHDFNCCFEWLELGIADVIGSTRGCTDPRLIAKTVEVFSLSGFSPEHSLTQCPNLWPSLLFTHRDKLLATDKNFNACCWEAGDYIESLDWTVPEAMCGDTFVNTSIQLRKQGNRFKYIHQHHNHTTDRPSDLLAEGRPWCHFGSLSTGILGLLLDTNNVALGMRLTHTTGGGHQPPPESSKDDIARRLAVFLLLVENYPLTGNLAYFNDIYRDAALRAVTELQIGEQRVNKNLELYGNYFGKYLRRFR